MNLKCFSVWSALALVAVSTACTKSSPTRPSDVPTSAAATTTVTDATTGATMTSPAAVSPASNAAITFASQPVQLVVSNGVTTSKTPLTYAFEVATDSAFASKVFTKENVAEGTGGQTKLTIDKLPGAKTYYWRAHSGSLTGPASVARAFVVGPEVVIQAPVLGDPAPGATVGVNPVLNVNRVSRTGPAGAIVYRFDVSEQSSFSTLVYRADVAERTDLPYTPHTVVAQLSEKTYFWRVQASDPSSSVTGAYSSTSSFKVQPFNIALARIWNNPADFNSWAETAKITLIEFTDNAILVDFDKRDGPGRWPDVGFGTGNLEYTLGMCVNIQGEWNCSATIQFWYGRDLGASGLPSEIGINWWYDARWGRLVGYQPSYGETVGIYVGAGNLRDSGNVILKERSNVVLMPFGGSYRALAAAAAIKR